MIPSLSNNPNGSARRSHIHYGDREADHAPASGLAQHYGEHGRPLGEIPAQRPALLRRLHGCPSLALPSLPPGRAMVVWGQALYFTSLGFLVYGVLFTVFARVGRLSLRRHSFVCVLLSAVWR
jgi:hypothetical protein